MTWRYRKYYPVDAPLAAKTLTCSHCTTGYVKYTEFTEFPSKPIEFSVDVAGKLPGSVGDITIHFFSQLPDPNNRLNNRGWVTNLKSGFQSFKFQPSPTRNYLVFFRKRSSSNQLCESICHLYIPKQRLFILSSFDVTPSGL